MCLHSLNTDLGGQEISKYIKTQGAKSREVERTQTTVCRKQSAAVAQAQEPLTHPVSVTHPVRTGHIRP